MEPGRLPFAAAVAKSAANLPTTALNRQIFKDCDSNERPPVRLSHGGSDQDLSGQPQGAREHQPVVLSGRQDRRARRQRLRQVDLAPHHGGHRQGVRRRGLGRRRRPRRLPRTGAAARSGALGARERDAGRGEEEGAARPLQRDRRQLHRRDRRGDGEAPGRDRQQEPVGAGFPGRPRDGGAALPARRRRHREAVRRRAPPRRAVPAAARSAGAAAARRADQPSRRRIGELAGRPSARLSGRHPDRHPRPLLPRQRHRLDPRARPRPRHSLPGQLLGLAGRQAEAAGAGGPRGRRAPAHLAARAGVDSRVSQGAAGQIEGALRALRGFAEAGEREADPDRADHHSGGGAARPERRRLRSSCGRATATTC